MKTRAGVLLALAGFGLVLLGGGCASVVSRPAEGADLRKYRRFFVEHRLVDNHFVDEYLARELARLGFESATGALTMKPDNADAIVTYEDRWQWDFWNYLIELTVEIHDARTDKLVARCRYYQPTLSTRGPAAICDQLLAPLFGPAAPAHKT